MIKIIVLIIGFVLIVPALNLIRERYKFLTETKQKVIAWLMGIGTGLIGLIAYWIIMAFIPSFEYEWLISDICFIGFIYLCSYVINVYSAKCTQKTHNRIIKEIEDFINKYRGEGECIYCWNPQEKIRLSFDYNKAGYVKSEKEFKDAVIIENSCCEHDKEEIKDMVFNLYLAHMSEIMPKLNL